MIEAVDVHKTFQSGDEVVEIDRRESLNLARHGMHRVYLRALLRDWAALSGRARNRSPPGERVDEPRPCSIFVIVILAMAIDQLQQISPNIIGRELVH